MVKRGRTKSETHATAGALLAWLVCGCAASPQGAAVTNSTSTAITNQILLEQTLWNARVQFDYNDFYTLTSPNVAGCAGDTRNYFDAFALRSLASGGVAPSPLPTDVTNGNQTIRPAFIKNVSVDVTDSNSTAKSNQAFGCSYGSGSSSKPPSACSTFDYPADGGVSSNLAGSMLLIGGIQGANLAGITAGNNLGGLAQTCGTITTVQANSCGTNAYAVGVDTLPPSAATNPPNSLVPGITSATSPISSFINLNSGTSYTGPLDFVGAAGAYDPGDNQFAMFGGSSVLGAVGAQGEAATNDTTWIFNLNQQKWTQLAASPAIDVALERTFEQDSLGSRYLSNLVTGRTNFGYAAMGGLAVNAMTTSSPYVAGATPVDSTDRIVIAGGQDGSGVVTDSYKFNPTYGPDWVNVIGRALENNGINTPTGSNPPAAGEPVQWLQNYHTQPLFNTTAAAVTPKAQFKPSPLATANPTTVINFGLTGVRDNNAADIGSSYALYMGGFDSTLVQNGSVDSCATPGGGSCAMMISRRTFRPLGTGGGVGTGETFPANFSSIGNLLFPTINIFTPSNYMTTQVAPSLWDSYTAVGNVAAPIVPYFGGSTLLAGQNINSNDVVFFAGSTCSNYLFGANTCVAPSFANPGVYFRLGTDPVSNPNGPGKAVPSGAGRIAVTNAPPARAGMAAARGTDGTAGVGNIIIVAFGGMSSSGAGADTNIYYLWFNAGTPTWQTATVAGGQVSAPGPAVVTNGSLVYSHVTKKYYLFGGYNPIAGAQSGDTWELSVGPANCGATGTCTFRWRQLNIANGLVCSPSCPQARRSHRMIEANYNNINPGGTIGGVTSGEPGCSATQPCSYGIFMEGGTNDGVNPISDRWIFDPTANAGWGLWQKMNEMPARVNSMMAAMDYQIPASSTIAHRAILFGGETGFADPAWASASNMNEQFVAPTLGDTWMYDFDTENWNRVNVLGMGYNGVPSATYDIDEFHNRQAYNATAPAGAPASWGDPRSVIQELAPPPTAGAMMITRTLSGPPSSGSPAPTLAIPEVYMIGGRLKDGSFQDFTHVYKFCAGTTGEAFSTTSGTGQWIPNVNDLTCDAYHATAVGSTPANPNSPSPQAGYVGRWLRKNPATGAGLSSYLGAAAYDSNDDLIVVWGGLQVTVGGTFVTDNVHRTTSGNFYEFTPPSAAAPTGTWNTRTFCAGQPAIPTARYGHSMVYDSRHQQLVVIGGYDVNGNPLTQTISSAYGNYQMPDMWKATRNTTFPTPCYMWTQATTIGNADTVAGAVPSNLGVSHMIAAYIPSAGFNTGYYSTFDSSCGGVGPIASSDPNVSKLLAGGVYFDIDRTQLGPTENLLLNLTFVPLGQSNNSPNSAPMAAADEAVFRIHLVQTGQSAGTLQSALQPRYLDYTGNSSFPQIVQSLSVVTPPTGEPRTEQVLIPLAANPNIDRIRVERYSGTAILIDASLYRMGQK